jgi:uncharacterized protein
MKSSTAVLLGVALLTLAGCEGGGRSHLSIGTGNTGGVYYPFGGALASRLSAVDPDRQYTAEVTAASVENVKRLAQRQIEIGMAISITAHQAYHGSADFPDAMGDLRIIAPLWPNPLNFLVTGNSGINTIEDLRGKRVAVGSAGSGTEQVVRALLATHGITYSDFTQFYLGFTEASSALRDGSVHAAFMEVAYPASAVLEATTTGNVRLLPLAGAGVGRLMDEWPVFFTTTIPAGSYPGVTSDVQTIAELNWILAREDLDPQIVRYILDILEDERDWLIQVTENARQIDLAELERAPIPVHAAALAWLAERRSP